MINTENKFKTPFEITGNWEQQSKRLKNKFTQLTDSDLKWDADSEDDLLNRIQTRLNKKREEVIKLINESKPAMF